MSKESFLLTDREWQWWFGVDSREAARLVVVQRGLAGAELDPSPETVLGMSRSVLAGAGAHHRLRALADWWEQAAPPTSCDESAWPIWLATGVRSGPLECREPTCRTICRERR